MDISLAGQWQFRQDPKRQGVAEKWYSESFSDTIMLPGSMEENGYGDIPRVPTSNDLNHTYYYKGWAWYQTEFYLSEEQARQHITLLLGHVQWDSFIWLDGTYIGNQNSLSVPHRYLLPKLAAGIHKLVILIDNSNLNTDALLPDQAAEEGTDSEGRSISLHLHTADNGTKKLACGLHGEGYAFNGIVGEVKLVLKPRLYIENVQMCS